MVQVTSGASDDLRQATDMARHMVTQCGLSDAIGPIYVEDEKLLGESLKQQIDTGAITASAEGGGGASWPANLYLLYCCRQHDVDVTPEVGMCAASIGFTLQHVRMLAASMCVLALMSNAGVHLNIKTSL